ncbi:MAG: neutral/alkaline non-lysosomal ceramidase N-terminal domain-containing protein [Acidimicrobiales bacterium]|nr:neutral/alkaline non-lysosomal ceramidase N-terminal domain-containing protein [Acidimicrobiales bacterium]
MAIDHNAIRTQLAPFVDGRSKRARFSVRPRPVRPLERIDGLLAGAAEVDITPPPGMPKAGYSANAHDGVGFHTRLRARITHLRADRSSIAIVQLDLLGGSSVLQHLVADAIAERTDVGLAGVWIGATHTHAGPGQFLGTDFYNHHASNRAGFDPAWTDFLVRRIAAGIIEAHDNRVPAKAAFGTTEVWGLTRNRSHDPYVQNETVTDKRQDPQRKWVAVNPRLNLLRVDRLEPDGSTSPLSAAVVFSIHGTGVSQHARDYNADVWAYLVGELGRRIEAVHGSRPVTGAMEGTHADVAPALRPGLAGHREARRVGTGIGAQAAELYESLEPDLTEKVRLDAGLREIDLDRDRTVDGITLPDRPAVGAALVAGATENLTPIIHRIPPFAAGHPRRRGLDNPQGHKRVIGTRWLQPLVLPKGGFPRILAVQVLRIGDVALVGLPFEITVESGRRIESAVAAVAADRGVDRVVVSSVVNEYWGYVATAEEYRRQFYEGGHTLYGPNTQRFLAAHARRVAEVTLGAGMFCDVGDERTWNLAARRYYARPTGSPAPQRRFEGRARFTDPTARIDGYWEQTWIDVEPAGLDWHEPLVRVEASDDDGESWHPAVHDDGTRADDQTWVLEVDRIASGDPGRHRYRVRWYEPVHRAGRRHRFVLLPNNGRPHLEGPPFD